MRKVYPILMIAGAFIFSIAVYNRLPEEIPVHWNWHGEVDRYGSRLEGAFLMPLIALGLWVLMRFLPRIDPRREHYRKFRSSYNLVVNAIITVMVVMHVLILGAALGWPIPLTRVVFALVGLLLIVIGNVPRARSNWWFGVRTPWTLSSGRVWARTHRLAGYVMLGAGVAMLLAAALPGTVTSGLAIGAVGIASLGSVVYSYWEWRKERRA